MASVRAPAKPLAANSASAAFINCRRVRFRSRSFPIDPVSCSVSAELHSADAELRCNPDAAAKICRMEKYCRDRLWRSLHRAKIVAKCDWRTQPEAREAEIVR